MTNPWLTIPLTDYEGHMGSQDVGQAQMLSQQLSSLLLQHEPQSLAVIGCAGGNGFDVAAAAGVQRLVGIDINAEYLREAHKRYASSFAELELYEVDVAGQTPDVLPVEFVYAGLVFEYVEPVPAIRNIWRLCAPGATFVALLQRPKNDAPLVTPSPFVSLGRLAPLLNLVVPKNLAKAASSQGFCLKGHQDIALPSGKTFAMLTFAAPS